MLAYITNKNVKSFFTGIFTSVICDLHKCEIKRRYILLTVIIILLSLKAQVQSQISTYTDSNIIYVCDNAVIHNVSAIYGDYTFVGTKQNINQTAIKI